MKQSSFLNFAQKAGLLRFARNDGKRRLTTGVVPREGGVPSTPRLLG
jgi:hypothetical protein